MSCKLAVMLGRALGLAIGLLFVAACDCAAQGGQRAVLPRIGVIKDYEATGMASGCNNYYFALPSRRPGEIPRYVFLARSEGQGAWMNLDGRDVPLRQLKSARRRAATTRRYKYLAGGLLITVVIRDLEPRYESANEEEWHMFEATITLRKGRAAWAIKVRGDADC